MEPYNNVRHKLNRAICASIVKCGAGGWGDTFPAGGTMILTYPYVIAHAMVGRPVVPGVFEVQVAVHIRGQASGDEAASEAEFAAYNERLARVNDALNMSGDNGNTLRATAYGTEYSITEAGRAMAVAADDSDEAIAFAAKNADMVDFTCQNWENEGFGDPDPDSASCTWEEILLFKALVCGSNVD